MQRPNPFADYDLRRRLLRFWADTSGAVTVDWIAITGAVLAMVIAFFAYFNGEMGNVAADLITKITSNL